MSKVYIVGGLRTPICKTNGGLKDILPEEMGACILNAIANKYHLNPNNIDQVILGNASGPGGNIARISLLQAGWSESIPGITVDYQCASGLSAINLAISQILAGQEELIIAGGSESTSLAPRRQFNKNDPRFDPDNLFYNKAPFAPIGFDDPEMGVGAEKLAKYLGISREEMDAQAMLSHKRASKAKDERILEDIILPIYNKEKKVFQDESIRGNISEKLLKRMPSAFVKGGNITGGNSCLTHDGAAAILLASENAVKKYNLKPEALIKDGIHVGVKISQFPLAPVRAIKNLCFRNNIELSTIDAFEINEAFAIKVIACARELGFPLEKVNSLGGALAYGHPYGASGCIIVLHLLKALEYSKGKLGIAALGAGGGTGAGIMIERL